MSHTLKEQIQQSNIIPKLSPLPNGKYKLPDNTILKVGAGKYEHIGHRNKRKQRELMRVENEDLKRMLQLPGYGGYNKDEIDRLNRRELANLLNPRPRCLFIYSWVKNPTESKAKKINSLMRKAVPFERKRSKNEQARR